jgi:beta-N-acetylhexosaminidase
MGAFEVRAGVRFESLRDPDHPPVIVTLETTPNIAVAQSPWGLAAAGVATIAVNDGQTPPDTDRLVLVGKDNHRHAWVREIIDAARARHPETLVIDMGWPSEDRRYADVATFGASRLAGEALAEWMRRNAE